MKIHNQILLVLFILILTPNLLSASPINKRIFGGGISTASDSISLLLEGESGVKKLYLCSGAFITKTKFLTAKHCVAKNGFKSPKFIVITSGDGKPVRVKKVQKSPKLDLAILTLNSPVGNPLPIMISRRTEIGELIQFYGYGQDEAQKTAIERDASTFLKYGESTLGYIDQSYFYFKNSQNGGACHGDSGGPMLALNSNGEPGIIGVANSILSKNGSSKCAAGVIAAYTKVSEGAGLNFVATYAPEALAN